MSSISAVSNQYQYTSPLDRLQNELTTEVQSGTINADDQNALTNALNNIDSSIQSNTGSTDSGPPAPGQIKSKIDNLISSEVQNGSLTSNQADELKGIFTKAFGGAHHAHGGHRSGGGGGQGGVSGIGETDSTNNTNDPSQTDPLLAALDSTSASGSSGSDGSTTTSSSSSDPLQLLESFIKSLQQNFSQTGYSAAGQNTNVSAALIVNFQS
jgi:hypothetical protein